MFCCLTRLLDPRISNPDLFFFLFYIGQKVISTFRTDIESDEIPWTEVELYFKIEAFNADISLHYPVKIFLRLFLRVEMLNLCSASLSNKSFIEDSTVRIIMNE